ncbi:uncharacterized protein LOC144250436 [Urocitellus parryii]
MRVAGSEGRARVPFRRTVSSAPSRSWWLPESRSPPRLEPPPRLERQRSCATRTAAAGAGAATEAARAARAVAGAHTAGDQCRRRCRLEPTLSPSEHRNLWSPRHVGAMLQERSNPGRPAASRVWDPLGPGPRRPRCASHWGRCCQSAGVKAPVVAATGAREPPLLLLESPLPGHWATRRRHPQHTGAKASLAAFRVREPAPAPPPPGTGAQPLPEHKSTETTAARVQSRDDRTLAQRMLHQAWPRWLLQLRRARGRTADHPRIPVFSSRGRDPAEDWSALKKELVMTELLQIGKTLSLSWNE